MHLTIELTTNNCVYSVQESTNVLRFVGLSNIFYNKHMEGKVIILSTLIKVILMILDIS